VHSIVTEPYKELPNRYSKNLKDLIASMLLKDDIQRPSTSNILDLPYIEKYMKEFIQEEENEDENFGFKKKPTATVYMQQERLQQVYRSKKVFSDKNLLGNKLRIKKGIIIK